MHIMRHIDDTAFCSQWVELIHFNRIHGYLTLSVFQKIDFDKDFIEKKEKQTQLTEKNYQIRFYKVIHWQDQIQSIEEKKTFRRLPSLDLKKTTTIDAFILCKNVRFAAFEVIEMKTVGFASMNNAWFRYGVQNFLSRTD